MKRIYAPWRSEYLRSERNRQCLFCTLTGEKEEKENWIIHRAKLWYVIVNTYPYSNGHVMVVSNRHVENLSELSGEERKELMLLLSKTEVAIRKAYEPDGINIGANLGRSAGAGVEGHLHIHLVPRWQGDTNFMTAIGETRVISEDLLETYERLKALF